VKKSDVVQTILQDRKENFPDGVAVNIFSPANIALCKYWGKRNQELNLPVTGSLSVSLGEKGTTTTLRISQTHQDKISLNGTIIGKESVFAKRASQFLDLFRTRHAPYFDLVIQSNIPIAAGLASSASGFASLVHALNQLFAWKCSNKELSILARLGSGSASRSIEPGFVEWYSGIHEMGLDSFGECLSYQWPELYIGLLIINRNEKQTSSREAMQRTVTTSPLYSSWPKKVSEDLFTIKQAISYHDFDLLGKTAESNAMSMHATMLSAWPPIHYACAETVLAMQKIWNLRSEGLSLYFTQDAGPNLKLLFLEKDKDVVLNHFPEVEIVRPFKD
jgi:diphosphomevalonate decarboxylase